MPSCDDPPVPAPVRLAPGRVRAALAILACRRRTRGRGHRASATGRASAAQPDPRPNIVMVLMDDASYELMASMPQRAEDAGRRGDVPQRPRGRLAVLPLAHLDLHRPAAPPQRRAHQHRQRPAHPLGGYTGVRGHHDASRRRSTSRCRSPATRPASSASTSTATRCTPTTRASTSRRPRSRGGTSLPRHPRWRLPRVGLLSTAVQDNGGGAPGARPQAPAAPRCRCSTTTTPPTRLTARAAFLHSQRDCDPKPYFLEVATYAPHAHLKNAYPDDPSSRRRSPTGRRRETRPVATAGRRRAHGSPLKDLRGYADPRADNAPTYLARNGRTTPAPAWNTTRSR